MIMYATKSDCYKKGGYFLPRGIVLHSIAAAQPSAIVMANLHNKPNYNVLPHAFIDAINGEVVQVLDWTTPAWHCGGSANFSHIGVEMCESSFLEYNTNHSAFSVKTENLESARKAAEVAYNGAVNLFATLCLEFGIDPLEDGAILSHKEAGKRGIASGHIDPEHLWGGLGLDYSMDGFRRDVWAAMNAQYEQPPKKDIWYKVQIGAFKTKEYAEACKQRAVDAGFTEAYIKEEPGD